MHTKKILAPVLLCGLMVPCLGADESTIPVPEPGTSFLGKATGLLAGVGVAAGAIYGFKHFATDDVSSFLPDFVINNVGETACAGAVHGASALVCGTIGYALASFFGSRGKKYYQDYKGVWQELEKHKNNPLITTPLGSIAEFAEQEYQCAIDGHCSAGIQEIEKLFKLLKEVSLNAQDLIYEIKSKSSSWYKLLTMQTQNIVDEIGRQLDDLREKAAALTAVSEQSSMKKESKLIMRLLEEVAQDSLLTCDLEKLVEHVKDRFSSKENCYKLGLEELENMENELGSIRARAKNIIASVKGREENWAIVLRKKCKKIRGDVDSLKVQVKERKSILVDVISVMEWEQEYQKSKEKLAGSILIEKSIFQDELVSRVKESCDSVIGYGITVVGGDRPFDGTVQVLRKMVTDVKAMVQDCLHEYTVCDERSKKDGRYKGLATEYNMLAQQIEAKFPTTLFEQRIREIFEGDGYKQEVKVKEKQKKHEEIVEALKNIKDEFSVTVSRLKKDISSMTKDVSSKVSSSMSKVEKGVEKETSKIKGALADVSRLVSTIEKEFNNKLAVVNSNILAVAQDVANSSNNGSNIVRELASNFKRLENILASVSNAVSRLEHDVSNVKRKVEDLGK